VERRGTIVLLHVTDATDRLQSYSIGAVQVLAALSRAGAGVLGTDAKEINSNSVPSCPTLEEEVTDEQNQH
jgi:hypothetical protein